MHNETIEQLKRLKSIRPDGVFLARSRRTILKGNAPFSLPVAEHWWVELVSPAALRVAGAITLLLLVLSLPSILVPPKPALSSSLNPDSLREEIQQTLAIQVDELRYEQSTNKAITDALNEIRDTSTQHLNPDLIERELESLESETTSETSIDSLLDRVLE